MTMTDTEAKAQIIATDGFVRSIEWPDPTPKMLDTILFDTIWRVIKSWDINVPNAYSGYMGATGNHARAIYDALAPLLEATEARHAAELREQAERFSEAVERVLTVPDRWQETHAWRTLSPFILPAPNPLVEEEDPIDALVDLLAPVLTPSQGMAARERENRFRNALAALRKIGEAK